MALNIDAKFKENWLLLHKCMEEFEKFSPEHLKVSKLGLWWTFFIRSRKFMSLKFTGRYLSWQWRMMQNWRRNWLVVSKLKLRIWQILTGALKNIKAFLFNGLFLIKVYNVWAKKVRRSYTWWHWRFNAKFEGPLICAF